MIAFALIQMFARRPLHAAGALLVLAALLVAPRVHADDAAVSPAAGSPLYREFGEKPAIAAVTHDFVIRLYSDPRTKDYFVGVSKKRMESKLSEQFCTVMNGPCVYTGRSMKRSHEGLNIDRAGFNAVVEELEGAMDKNRVPYHAQNQFLALLAPMYREIEERN